MASVGGNANTLNTLNGLTKTKFAPKIIDRIPASVKFFSRLGFGEAMNLGKKYQQPVDLILPQGMTYAAPNSGAFDIEDAEAGQSEVAEVDANQFLFTDLLDYESAAKAQKASDGAYEAAIGKVIRRAMKAATKRIELSFLYGGTSLGVVGALAASTDNGDGTYTRKITVRTDTWASGIWLGMQRAKLEFRVLDANGYVTATRHGAGVIKLKKLSVSQEALWVTGAQADVNAIAAGDGIVFGGTYGKETMGLDRIVTNKGILHGINADEYEEQWAGNVYPNGGRVLTLKRIYDAMGDSIAKGLEDMDVLMFLNPLTFGNLLATEAGLRRYFEATGQGKAGMRSLKFEGQHGNIEFVPYINIKQGESMIVPIETYAKVGASDLTMQAPGRKEHEFWKDMEGKAGFEMRLYANLGLFCDAPGQSTKITEIVNDN